MTKKIILQQIFIGLIFVCLTANAAFAQTTAFNYQGKLTDGGNPASGNYQLQFKLFDAAVNGTQIGATLSDVAVTATQGVFNAQLDFGANVFPGADRFLEIAVRRNSNETYTILNPRQQIAASPYSIRTLSAQQADLALDSNKLGGIFASEYVTTSSVGNAFIRNMTTQQASANFNISGNGFFGGNVGIGTTSPTSRLQIAGQDGLSIVGFQPFFTLFDTNAGNARARIQNGNGDIVFYPNSFIGGIAPMIIKSGSGYIGVGTPNPFAKLTVQTVSNDYGFMQTDGIVKATSYIGANSSGTSGGWFGTQSNHPLYFFANGGQPKMTIDTTGNVGIGTTTPITAKLEVEGGSGVGVKGIGNTYGVRGESTTGDGVLGYTLAANKTGVSAYNFGGGNAIFASGNSYTTGNVMQDLSGNGLVKAMIYVNQNATIVRCYNGMTSSTTGNCGFVVSREPGTSGEYVIDFPFPVNNRFVSVTPRTPMFTSAKLGTWFLFDTERVGGSNPNRISVGTFFTDDFTHQDCFFMIIVY